MGTAKLRKLRPAGLAFWADRRRRRRCSDNIDADPGPGGGWTLKMVAMTGRSEFSTIPCQLIENTALDAIAAGAEANNQDNGVFWAMNAIMGETMYTFELKPTTNVVRQSIAIVSE
ncbi:hypothetical protein IFR05_003499 [Cadophora sp. M221]|nr:hypothetical protein IFR05_003499 [Cadophora sp. M221]